MNGAPSDSVDVRLAGEAIGIGVCPEQCASSVVRDELWND
jgi:hypothetical protein